MDRSSFTNKALGHLEPTTFQERSSHRPYGVRTVAGIAFIPDPLPAKLTRSELLNAAYEELVRAERALSELQGAVERINPNLLIDPFTRREAKLSSAIENTFASPEQMALFDLDPTSIEPEERDEVREVVNYARALRYGLKSSIPLSLRLVRELHRHLLEGVERKAGTPGEFRTTQNAIGRPGQSFADARFVPPPPQHLQQCLSDWEKFLHSESDLPRLVKFAMSHYQFECIHPFDDGNGRVGRLLIALQLCDQAQLSQPLVYVSGYFEKHRSDYYDLMLRVSTHGDWLGWIKFFLTAIHEQADDARQRARRLADLRDDYHARVREKRASALLPKIVDELFMQPSLTVARVTKQTGLSPQSAGKLVSKLVEKNILEEVTGRKSYRIFYAPEIAHMIDH